MNLSAQNHFHVIKNAVIKLSVVILHRSMIEDMPIVSNHDPYRNHDANNDDGIP